MRQSLTVIVLAGIAAIGLTSPTLRAGSLAQLHAGVIAGQRPIVERVAYRRCWWRKAKRHCRLTSRTRPRSYGKRRQPEFQEPNLPPNLGWGL